MENLMQNYDVQHYSDYLDNIGLFLQDQQKEQLVQIGNDLNQSIQYLSDHFQQLSKNDLFFQLSKSIIFSYFQQKLEENSRYKQENKQQTDKIQQKVQQLLEPNNSLNVSFSNNGQEQQNIHQKLYQNANTKQKYQTALEDLKTQLETQNCTFKPQINKQNEIYQKLEKLQGSKNQSVHERLSKKKVVFNKENSTQMFKKQQQQQQNVQQQQLQQVQQQLSKNSSRVFDRLYQDSFLQQEKKQIFEEIKNKMEQQEVEKQLEYQKKQSQKKQTKYFSSQSNYSTPKSSRDNNKEISKQATERLYNNHFDRESQKIIKHIEQRDKDLQECSFKPEINKPGSTQYLNDNNYTVQQINNGDVDKQCFQRLYDRAQQKNMLHNMNENGGQQQIQHQNSRSPIINKKSQNLVFKDPAHIRLYNISKTSQNKKSNLKQKVNDQQGCTFRPVINQNTDQILLNKSSNGGSLYRNSSQSFIYNNNNHHAKNNSFINNNNTSNLEQSFNQQQNQQDNESSQNNLYTFNGGNNQKLNQQQYMSNNNNYQQNYFQQQGILQKLQNQYNMLARSNSSINIGNYLNNNNNEDDKDLNQQKQQQIDVPQFADQSFNDQNDQHNNDRELQQQY